MPEFDKNAAFLWALIGLGIGVPLLLAIYASLRARFAKARLLRLQNREDARGLGPNLN